MRALKVFRFPGPLAACFVLALMGVAGDNARAVTHQTSALTPLASLGDLPFRITVQPADPRGMALPTLHSYSAAEYDGKWVLLGGRTNGLHGFEQSGSANFPPASQNRDVWVVDWASGQSWHRALDDAPSGLSAGAIAALSVANTEFAQLGDRLYVVGGYGQKAGGGLGTLDTLTAVDLPGMVAWAMGGPGAAAPFVRQTTDPQLTVTGGGLIELGGRMQLVVGQNFSGGYTPGKTGVYTRQVRSFDIVDDGTTLSTANWSATTPDDDLRRRDLNVFPVLSPDGVGGADEGIVVLSGVFTPDDGAWTVPIVIDAAGTPSMADPLAPDTFKQGFNGYHSAKLGLYSAAAGAMHEVLFGGISLQYLDETTGIVGSDDNFPFVNDVTAVTIDAAGEFSQRHLGYFPELLDLENNRLRFGANAEFFLAPGVALAGDGVIDLDALTGPTTLGYVFGGIESNAPNTRGVTGAISAASNLAFEVIYTPATGIPADFNNDALVNAADLSLWKTAYGNNPGGDANNDAQTTGADFLVWQRAAGAQAASTVPELSTLSLMLVAIGGRLSAKKRQVLADS